MKFSVILLLIVLTAISVIHTPPQSARGGSSGAGAPVASESLLIHVQSTQPTAATDQDGFSSPEASPPAIDPDPSAPFLSSVPPHAY